MLNIKKESDFAELLRTLTNINSGFKSVEIKEIKNDPDDDDLYDQEDTHTMTDLRGDKYIVDDEESSLADLCSVLITEGGRPDYDYISKLKAAGFDVFPTEKDSFGWLGAAVRTNKGLIFFG